MGNRRFDDTVSNPSTALFDVDPWAATTVRSIERGRKIEEYHWRNLLSYFFPAGDGRATIGICSIAEDRSTAGFISRLCLHAALHLASPVLLIEAYAAQRSLADRYGVLPAPGLGDLLASPPAPLYRCISRTEYAQLWMIPFGRALATCGEQELARRYREMAGTLPPGLRNIVLALPPVRAGRDLPFPCSVADRIIFVVEPNSIRGRDLQAAANRLTKASAKVSGVIWSDRGFSDLRMIR